MKLLTAWKLEFLTDEPVVCGTVQTKGIQSQRPSSGKEAYYKLGCLNITQVEDVQVLVLCGLLISLGVSCCVLSHRPAPAALFRIIRQAKQVFQ